MSNVKHVGELVKDYVSRVKTANERSEADVNVLEIMRLEDVYKNIRKPTIVDARLNPVRQGLKEVKGIYDAKGWTY